MDDVYDDIPASPAVGCYERFAAMRRKRSSSVNAKVIEETIRKRTPRERKRSTPNLNIRREDVEGELYETCLDAKNSFYSNGSEHTEVKKNGSASNGLNYSYCTAPRARRIWDKKNRRRSGSVPNVSFTLPASSKPSSLTFYAPSRQHSRAQYDVTTSSSTRTEKRCLQLLIDDLDSNAERMSKSKRKDALEINGMDSKKLCPPSQPTGRRRSLPAIFSKGRESSPLSLFKRSAPDLHEDISEVDGQQYISTVKAKGRRNSQRKVHSSWTLPVFPWKRNGHKNGYSQGLGNNNL